MTVPGLLLTGGASTRMGRPKAELRWGGERLADRVTRVVGAVCAPVVEVGPGYSALPAVAEDPPGSGPLAALVAGVRALGESGAAPPVLVVAVDMPFVSEAFLTLLRDHPGPGSIVPVASGRAQPLCARYSPGACERAAVLVAAGERSMRALLGATDVELVHEGEWREVTEPNALVDLDTPDDLSRWQTAGDG